MGREGQYTTAPRHACPLDENMYRVEGKHKSSNVRNLAEGKLAAARTNGEEGPGEQC